VKSREIIPFLMIMTLGLRMAQTLLGTTEYTT
jgi:hypothetical protein